jgi:hypothetical protein
MFPQQPFRIEAPQVFIMRDVKERIELPRAESQDQVRLEPIDSFPSNGD